MAPISRGHNSWILTILFRPSGLGHVPLSTHGLRPLGKLLRRFAAEAGIAERDDSSYETDSAKDKTGSHQHPARRSLT
jgi:hypothetical protein